MDSIRRKARKGEKIIIVDPRKGWNALTNELSGVVMTVSDTREEGVYTEEIGRGMYINHSGYEVVLFAQKDRQ